jgi:alpha-L-rhamnosidase
MLLIAGLALLYDNLGPVPYVNRGRIVGARVSPGSVQVDRLDFDPSRTPKYPGAGNWIGIPDSKAQTAVLFRKELDLADDPQHVDAWFSADAHARIYVNGRLVARGPDDGGQDYPGTQTGRWFVNYRDFTPFFHRGRNSICAEVFSARAMEGRYNSTGQAGFLFEAKLNQRVIASDGSWHVEPGPQWRFGPYESSGDSLWFDANQEPVGWLNPVFDDSKWQPAALLSGAWENLELSQIPPRLEATYPWTNVEVPSPTVAVKGRTITFNGDGSCRIKFDRVLSGFVDLKLDAPIDAVLAVKLSEPDGPGFNRMAAIVTRGGEQTVELPFYDGFSVINLVASHVSGPLRIQEVKANLVAQPVSYQGSFSCSDPGLTQDWAVARWLTQICQQTHHLDSPDHQEPICDPGDYLIISCNNYCAFGQPWLARQDLRKYAWLLRATKFRPFHTSYALLWLQMLTAYWDYTGDASLVKELSPEVHALLDQFASYRGSNGILSEAPDYMFMDWVTIDGFECHHPPAVIGQGYLTAFYYRALEDGIRVAELSGDQARAGRYRSMRQEIFTAYNRELWDPEAGLYLDGKPFVTSVKPADWLPADKDIRTHSSQNNSLAVLYGLATPDRRREIMSTLLSHDLNTQPYFMHFIFGALGQAGLFDELATPQMRRWKIVPETQSFREMWNVGDYSHAWQCTPLFQLSSRVLGITPASPGFGEIRVRPHPCDLKWATGSMPTPHGPVSVHWTRSEHEFRVELSVPKGSRATAELPLLGPAATLEVDGRSVPTNESEGYATAKLPSGRHVAVLRF